MTGTGMQIIRIVADEGRADAATVAHRMGVSPEYITPHIRSVAQSGYLRSVGGGVFAIEQKGIKALFPFAGRKRGPREPVSNYP